MRYLFVDAYNVIHAIEELRMALGKGLDSARDRLMEYALSIHDAELVQMVLVFDGNRKQLEVDYPLKKKTFELVYAPARISADGVIEQLLTRVSKPENVTVVSNDGMVREATRVGSAATITAQEFCDWAISCKKRLERDAVQRNKAFEKEWKNNIDIKL